MALKIGTLSPMHLRSRRWLLSTRLTGPRQVITKEIIWNSRQYLESLLIQTTRKTPIWNDGNLPPEYELKLALSSSLFSVDKASYGGRNALEVFNLSFLVVEHVSS